MQVVKNMLASNANKGPYMKLFFVLLFPLVLIGCGSEPDVDTQDALSAAPAESDTAAQVTLPKAQADAVAAIKMLGGGVTLDAKSGEVASIYVSGTQFTDTGLAHVKGLTRLETLTLSQTQLSDAGLVHLKGLTSLTTLHLGDTQITGAGLVHVKDLTRLVELYLVGTQITDAGLEHLKGLTSLTELWLSQTEVTDTGLEHLKGLTRLTFLNDDE